eukprot:6007025-Prymnesium_polylepis.2
MEARSSNLCVSCVLNRLSFEFRLCEEPEQICRVEPRVHRERVGGGKGRPQGEPLLPLAGRVVDPTQHLHHLKHARDG